MKHPVNFIRNFKDFEDELDITEVFAKIKDGEFEDVISRYRYALCQGDPNAPNLKNHLLAFTPAGIFEEHRKGEALKKYSGILHLDIDKLENHTLMTLTSQLKKDNMVFAFFISPSGNGLKVFYKTNSTSENHSKFSSLLFSMFEEKYDVKPDSQVKDLPRLCFVSDDPNLYLNLNSQPVDFLENNKYPKIKIIEGQLVKSFNLEFTKGQRNAYVFKLAAACRNQKIDREELLQFCLTNFQCESFDFEEINTSINSAYDNQYYQSKKPTSRNFSKHEILEVSLTEMGFEFRYNIVKKRVEIKINGNEWLEIEDRMENDLIKELEKQGLPSRLGLLKTSLNSSFSHDYNPFLEYLLNLPTWNGEDYIGELFTSLNADDELKYYLEKWLVALVASILDHNVQNQTVLLLIGTQGVGKSRWLGKLIPPSLRQYFVQGIFDPRDKDTKILMSENLIGNLDELDSIEKRDVPKFKEFITSPGTKIRASYARNAMHFPRRISFCGSVNSLDFLQDLTGSRRFLCIEVKGMINHAHKINMDMVYSQALALYNQGCKPYFDLTESKVIQERNEKFQSYSIEEEILREYFEPNENKKPSDRMTLLQIIQEIEKLLGENSKIRISHPKLGKILARMGFEKIKSNSSQTYCIKRREGGI
jgi:hypothetical protein